MPSPEAIRAYLAAHDHFCPCGYNLRGLSGTRCPECAREIEIPPDPDELEAQRTRELVAYLRNRDVRCKHCGYNLRGMTTNRCPECNASYMLAGGAPAMTNQSRRKASPAERVRSRLLLISVLASLLLFAAIFFFGVGLVPMTRIRGLSIFLLLIPWALAFAWSLRLEQLSGMSRETQGALGMAAVLGSLACIGLFVAAAFFS